MDPTLLRLINLRSPPFTTARGGLRLSISALHMLHSHYATATETFTKEPKHYNNNKDKWYTLPPFTTTLNGTAIGKELSGRRTQSKPDVSNTSTTTALKWVLRCCPDLPRSLVQKLFRLRQVHLKPNLPLSLQNAFFFFFFFFNGADL
jgi:hypothetical protein